MTPKRMLSASVLSAVLIISMARGQDAKPRVDAWRSGRTYRCFRAWQDCLRAKFLSFLPWH